ncbi:MAG: hypothetical protein IMW89_01445 [Ktedonobacteraceae bacterium]|nr:hypothetical protein [Ktedonobacteraceae bacterium]
MKTCPICHGTGKVQGNVMCSRCDGTGAVVKEDDFYRPTVMACLRCRGKGYLENGEPCPDRYKKDHP